MNHHKIALDDLADALLHFHHHHLIQINASKAIFDNMISVNGAENKEATYE